MVFQFGDDLAVGCIPQADCFVVAGRRDVFAVRRKNCAVDSGRVALKQHSLFSRICVPDARRAVIARGHELLAVG